MSLREAIYSLVCAEQGLVQKTSWLLRPFTNGVGLKEGPLGRFFPTWLCLPLCNYNSQDASLRSSYISNTLNVYPSVHVKGDGVGKNRMNFDSRDPLNVPGETSAACFASAMFGALNPLVGG